jgi:short-subunit dehydrogenase
LTEALHEEMRGSGVRVTALCPGLTRTEFQSISSTEQYSRDFPSFSWLDVTDVARAGLRDVARGRALSVPGALWKALVVISDVLPRAIVRRISAFATGRR